MTFSHVLLAVLGAILAYTIYVHAVDSRLLLQLRREFKSRPRRNEESWFGSEFSDLGIARDRVMALVKPVAEVLECDVTQLRATDSFKGTLKWRGWLSPWDDYFEVTLWGLTDDHDRLMDAFKSLFDGDPTLHAIISMTSTLSAGGGHRVSS